MRALYDTARRLAAVDINLVLLGETGVGKTRLARQIHDWSPRASGPFVDISCAGLSGELLDSALFGHEKGAFTGAVSQRIGALERADGGTLFLDEIGDASVAIQLKLLTALESGHITRVGADASIPVDVRVLSATHRDLLAERAQGRFRDDLYYRLVKEKLRIPPLRDRKEEIVPLACLFLRQLSERRSRPAVGLSPSTVRLLTHYRWKGNVRELHGAMERAMTFVSGTTVLPEHLPEDVRDLSTPAEIADSAVEFRSGNELDRLESGWDRGATDALKRRMLIEALERSNGVNTRAASLLKVTRRTVYSWRKHFGV